MIAVAAGTAVAKTLEALVEAVVIVKAEAIVGKVVAVVFDGCSSDDNGRPVDVTVLVVNIPGAAVANCEKDVIIGNGAEFVTVVTTAAAVVAVDCPL